MKLPAFIAKLVDPARIPIHLDSSIEKPIKDLSVTQYQFMVSPEAGQSYTVDALSLRFTGHHDYPEDVTVSVTSPTGRSTIVKYADDELWWAFDNLKVDISDFFRGESLVGPWIVEFRDEYEEDEGMVLEVHLEGIAINKLCHKQILPIPYSDFEGRSSKLLQEKKFKTYKVVNWDSTIKRPWHPHLVKMRPRVLRKK